MMMKKLGLWLTGVVFYLLVAVALYFSGRYGFQFMEQWRTFYLEGGYMADVMGRIGGFSILLADFLVQFFRTPVAGVLVAALPLTLIAMLTARVAGRMAGSNALLPAGLLVAGGFIALLHNLNFQFQAVTAMLIMLCALSLETRIKGCKHRLEFSTVTAVILYLLTGPAASAFALLVLVFELFKNPRMSWTFISVPLLVVLAAYITVLLGGAGEIRHLLLPDGYFTLRLEAPSIVWMPWIILISVLSAACLIGLVRKQPLWFKTSLLCISAVGAVLFGWNEIKHHIDRGNETFKRLCCRIDHQDWEGLLKDTQKLDMNNLLYQNCAFMALAENDALADGLFLLPCHDIQSLYVQTDKSPYISGLVADVYYSMGHMAFSQRYAFEANESAGGYSPRLLKRLALTNICFGYDQVARKYLRLLKKTLFHHEWACHYLDYLDGKVADATMDLDKACIFPDNKLSGAGGLDEDLKRIVRDNPERRSSVQYLFAVCLLAHDKDRFMDMANEFYGTSVLTDPMPRSVQEAIALYSDADAQVLQQFHINPSLGESYRAFLRSPRTYVKSFWYFYKYIY